MKKSYIMIIALVVISLVILIKKKQIIVKRSNIENIICTIPLDVKLENHGSNEKIFI